MTRPAPSPPSVPRAPVLAFREQALHRRHRTIERADVLHLTPGWARGTSWLVAALLLGAAVAAIAVQVPRHAEGPAVVRASDAREVTAPVSGRIERVHVVAGERVHRGHVLLTIDAAEERAQLARIEREYELRLIDRLRRPYDPQSGSAIASLRAERAGALARLAAKAVRAPDDGIVGDVSARAGEFRSEGDALLSILAEGARFTVLALLPGDQRPLLAAGQPVVIELAGHRGSTLRGVVARVPEHVVGPSEARRVLGAGVADGVPLAGAVALCEIEVDAATFRAGATELSLYRGMLATARVRVGASRLLRLLLPGGAGACGG